MENLIVKTANNTEVGVKEKTSYQMYRLEIWDKTKDNHLLRSCDVGLFKDIKEAHDCAFLTTRHLKRSEVLIMFCDEYKSYKHYLKRKCNNSNAVASYYKNMAGIVLTCGEDKTDITYEGFNMFKQVVANIVDHELGLAYSQLKNCKKVIRWGKGKFMNQHVTNLIAIAELLKVDESIVSFLLSNDKKGRLTVKQAKTLNRLIKKYDDDVLYSHFDLSDSVVFDDFKEILKKSIENKSDITWE